uniref:Glutamic acid-rich protein-like n=1 Tax=Tanacetum cinerariifolium TaxID=118510 RepID=A0A699J120_TANCI|nr:hypothetical protein [Tanacetum cinerariifolium]
MYPEVDDAKGTSCLTNTKIFEGLARMGYEKPSNKLTFYKAFFSPQWKLLIHTILQCLSAKTTSWNKFSSTMASAIICLATNQKFNFSRYILLSLVKNIEAGVPLFMFPRFVQLIINHQLGDMTHPKDIFDTPSLTKKVFANMKRVGTGFFREVTILFNNMLVQAPKEVGILQADKQPIPIPTKPSTSKPQKKHKRKTKHTKEPEDSLKLKELMDLCTNLSNKVLDLKNEVIDIKSTYKVKIKKLESRVEKLEDENKVLKGLKDLDHQEKVLSMLDVNDEESAGVEEVLEVVTAAKLITKVVTTAGVDVNDASVEDTPITAAEATKVIVEVHKPRKRRGVIIQDSEETTTVTVQPKVQAKDKGKAILIEEPKPLKRQVQIDLDEEVTRQLEAELNADINWNVMIEQVKRINKGIKLPEKEVRQEKEVEVESSKRKVESLEQEITKKQKIEKETEELKSIFLLVEKMYPLTHFTLEQMVNDVRLKVDYESEMSLKLLRLVKR